ncbi:BnaAnng21940D [Brassica napus]|uniref:BnaAnng21940D protein n=1 Tax=Brassica napus TaxID=3708 RepID=A0A078JHX8_BRANA|nr:BnaAnng21940D [Brassica napus]
MFYQKKEKKQEVDVAVLLINDTSANIHNTIDNSNPDGLRAPLSGRTPKSKWGFKQKKSYYSNGADQANFSVYVHSQPDFVFNEETTRSHYFYNRQLNNSINVIWGEYSMIQAERLLLSTALDDHSNQRFILLSDSCAPLYDFGYIYKYLISSPRSFVDSFINTKERRYSMNMSSVIPEEKWRKGSQWISVIRSHAELIVNDGIVFSAFEKFCKMRGLESEMEPRTLTCAPLYDFGYIYKYLISSPRSFVDSFINTKERRYSMNMSSVIPEEKWRKGSQWISVIRSHAELIVNDGIVFSAFEKFCKKAPPFGSQEAQLSQNLRNCIPDEHYIQTLLTMRGLESEMEPRTLTYTVWDVSGSKHGAKSWHPVTFTYENSGPEDLQEIKSINHVNYESESRTDWCKADSKPVPCFLFARKFTKEAAMRWNSRYQ